MKTADAKKILEANRDRVAIFISDPTQGDQIVVTNTAVVLPRTCTGTDIDHVSHFLDTLDFEAYNGDGPRVTVHRV